MPSYTIRYSDLKRIGMKALAALLLAVYSWEYGNYDLISYLINFLKVLKRAAKFCKIIFSTDFSSEDLL